MIHLDTHVVVWLYLGELSLFPPAVRNELNRSDLVASPIIELELQYLFEIERVTVPAIEIVTELQESIGLRFRVWSAPRLPINGLEIRLTELLRLMLPSRERPY